MSADHSTSQRTDAAVSAVIGVILMVAITVAIAATVYIWAGGFGAQDGGSESASATARTMDKDGDNTADYLRITLASGPNAPYVATDVTTEVVDPTGAVHSFICETADYDGGTTDCTQSFAGSSEWDVGTSLFFPCQASGNHQITVAVLQTTILDRSVRCGEVAPS